MASDDAIIIKDLWGKILSAIVITGILGGVAFAFDQNATNAQVKTLVDTIEKRGYDRDARLNKLGEKVENVQRSVNDVRSQQIRIETKLDYLIDKGENAR